MKKGLYVMGLSIISIFIFFSMEYVMYKLLIPQNPLFAIAFVLFLTVVFLNITLLNNLGLPNKIIAPVAVLIAVFLGMALLKWLLPILG